MFTWDIGRPNNAMTSMCAHAYMTIITEACRETDCVCLAHFRVPNGTDLFECELADLPRGDALDNTLELYCLCANVTSESEDSCGRIAVSDTSQDEYEPKFNVGLGVPPQIVGERRRRKRQINEVILHDDSRVYRTSYR